MIHQSTINSIQALVNQAMGDDGQNNALKRINQLISTARRTVIVYAIPNQNALAMININAMVGAIVGRVGYFTMADDPYIADYYLAETENVEELIPEPLDAYSNDKPLYDPQKGVILYHAHDNWVAVYASVREALDAFGSDDAVEQLNNTLRLFEAKSGGL